MEGPRFQTGKHEEGEDNLLRRIRTTNIGPAADMSIEPGEGTSLITGVNGLGRTLLLDAAWRALTGRWPCEAYPEIETGRPALPTTGAAVAVIEASEIGPAGEVRVRQVRTRAQEHTWHGPIQRTDRTLIYAHGNGAVSAWIGTASADRPARRASLINESVMSAHWNGTRGEVVSEYLGASLAAWQRNERAQQTLRAAMRCTVPEAGAEPEHGMAIAERVARGDAVGGATERLTEVACMLTWAVLESTKNSLTRGVTLLFDDVELHLHPTRQRTVLEGLRSLATEVLEAPLQLIATTNAPLVLASSEPWFDSAKDRLFTLETDRNGRTIAREHAYTRHGTARNWLTSDALGLPSDRNLAAEAAIGEAKRVALKHHPRREEVQAADEALRAALPDDDDFWPRWRYFAEQQLDKEAAEGKQAPEK